MWMIRRCEGVCPRVDRGEMGLGSRGWGGGVKGLLRVQAGHSFKITSTEIRSL